MSVASPRLRSRVCRQWRAHRCGCHRWRVRRLRLGAGRETVETGAAIVRGHREYAGVRRPELIVRALGGTPPDGFNYELFLDQNGERISKSKGNGLSIEEWLTYGPEESIALFMFQKPRVAKRLYFDVIPKAVDDYLEFLRKYLGR